MSALSRNTSTPQSYLPSTPPDTPPDEDIELEFYNLLTRAGGRPVFPIERRDEVRATPEASRQLLEPWSDAVEPWESLNCRRIFINQCDSWQDFRLWQQEKRAGCKTDDPPCRATSSQDVRRSGESSNFSAYVADVQSRLCRHWFIWQDYKVCEDLQEQDILSTWIEYLNYAYLCVEIAQERALVFREHKAPGRNNDVSGYPEARRTRWAASQCEGRAFWIRDQVPLIASQLSITMPCSKKVRFSEHITFIEQDAGARKGEENQALALKLHLTSSKFELATVNMTEGSGPQP